MSMFEDCLSIVNSCMETAPLADCYGKSISLPNHYHRERLDNLSIYYISDIHLEHQIIKRFPNGATNQTIKEFIRETIFEMLKSEIALSKYNSSLVFFGGDTASSFPLATFFFTEFIAIWDSINKSDYDLKRSIILPLLQEQENNNRTIMQWQEAHKWVSGAKKDLLEYSDKRVPPEIKHFIVRNREIEEIINETTDYHITYYLNQWEKPEKSIYVVLGNHELWEFDSFEDSIKAYKLMFENLGIVLLNNTAYWSSGYGFHKLELNEDTAFYKHSELKFNRAALYNLNNVVITGGVGFAAYNKYYNASNGLYRDTIDLKQELEYTIEWENYYSRIVDFAKEKRALLIVLTHNPFSDWNKDTQPNSNCIYFSGHNHRNVLWCHDDINAYYYSDNQIGYQCETIKFKKAEIYKRANPFADYDDGYYIINTFDYVVFNRFFGIYIEGTSIIQRYIDNAGDLYMIKNNGYYGFFLISKKVGEHMLPGTFICKGGRIERISDDTNITKYYDTFSGMIRAYLNVLSPYRHTQEMIAEAVRAFGGTGRIHGYIIDIDFTNHIMLNPNDGKVTFYHSPIWGYIITFSTLRGLLSEHAPSLLSSYNKSILSVKNGVDLLDRIQNNDGFNNTLLKLRIKSSIYIDSNKMNQLQRLFDANILRDWNENILRYTNSFSTHELISN